MTPTETESDEALLNAAREGDREALDALVARYEPRVYRFGLSLCRDSDDADDVLQDTFLSMVRSLRNYRGDASLSTWLFAIAHHACLKKRRRRKFSPKTVESIEALSPAEQNSLAAPTASPEASAITGELQRSLQTAIGALDATQREVLLLRDVEGLTAPDTARLLGLSVAAVKSRLHRARVAVRAALAPILPTTGTVPPSSTCVRCRDIALAFSKHLEGDLSQADCAEMEAHMTQCTACKSLCASLQQVLALCRSAAPEVPLSTQRALRDSIRACMAGETVEKLT